MRRTEDFLATLPTDDTDATVAMCQGKEKIESFVRAKEIAGRRHKRRGEPYRCPVCHSWHVGRKKKRQKPKRTIRL